ncbi:MAG: hypothetical protein ACE5F1_02895 [Planctomycetota bacterium]
MLARSTALLLLCPPLCSQGAVEGTPPRDQPRPGEAREIKPVKKEPTEKENAIRPRTAAERLKSRMSKQWTREELLGLSALLDVSVFQEPARIAPGAGGSLFLKIPVLGIWGSERAGATGSRIPIELWRRATGPSSRGTKGLPTRFLIQPHGRIEVDSSSDEHIKLRSHSPGWDPPRNGDYYQDTFLVRIPFQVESGTEHGEYRVKGRIQLSTRLQLLPLSPADIRLRKAMGAPTDQTAQRSLLQSLGLREVTLEFSGMVKVGPALPSAVLPNTPEKGTAGDGSSSRPSAGPAAGEAASARPGSGETEARSSPNLEPRVEASSPRAELDGPGSGDLEAEDGGLDLPLLIGSVLCLGLLLLVLRASRV